MARYDSLILIAFLFVFIHSSCGAETPERAEFENRFFTAAIPFAATNKYLGARLRYIPTNTVAFQKYAMKAMLEHINFLNERWELGLAKPINFGDMTALELTRRLTDLPAEPHFPTDLHSVLNTGNFDGFLIRNSAGGR
ncbi:MAG: hypothetical protein ACO1QB_00570 [Verrucomicrobiales bacterium]